jgi:hypothetical protein
LASDRNYDKLDTDSEVESLMSNHLVELRRHPRSRVSWPVTVEAGGQSLQRETLDVSRFGAKVRMHDELLLGSTARLSLRRPQDGALDVDSIVWRADPDGMAFFFFGGAVDELSFGT